MHELETIIHKTKRAALVYRAINNRLRQQILRYLLQNQGIAVTQLYTSLRIEQSVASQHLAILRRAGIVTGRRDGKHIYYSVNEHRLKTISCSADQVLERENK